MRADQPFVMMVPSVSAKTKAPAKADSTGDWSSSRSSCASILDIIVYFYYYLVDSKYLLLQSKRRKPWVTQHRQQVQLSIRYR